MKRGMMCVVSACALSAAIGVAPSLTLAQQNTTRAIHEGETLLRLWTPSPSGGYAVRLETILYGVSAPADATRMDVKVGGRVVASQRCTIEDREGNHGRVRCGTDEAHLLTAVGDVTVEFYYLEDATDRAELLRTFNVQVRRYPDWMQADGARITQWGARYQILAHDTIGTAFVWHENPTLTQTEAEEPQALRFYTAFASPQSRVQGNNYSLRCTVNGTRIPDIEARIGRQDTIADVVERTNTQTSRTVEWNRAYFDVPSLWWGHRIPMPASGAGHDTANVRFLADHAGSWSCDLRMDGQVLRTFVFTVGADGRVAPHPEQQSYRQVAGLSLIDVRIPANSPFDSYIDPAAIRTRLQFGQPRTQPAAAGATLSSLPSAATGNAEPTPTPGGGGRRRGR